MCWLQSWCRSEREGREANQKVVPLKQMKEPDESAVVEAALVSKSGLVGVVKADICVFSDGCFFIKILGG